MNFETFRIILSRICCLCVICVLIKLCFTVTFKMQWIYQLFLPALFKN